MLDQAQADAAWPPKEPSDLLERKSEDRSNLKLPAVESQPFCKARKAAAFHLAADPAELAPNPDSKPDLAQARLAATVL